MAQTLYINPSIGSDSNAGTESAPFKTIAHALERAQSDPDTEIRLSAGNYNADSGESFPLDVLSGVKIIGNEGNKGSDIVIEGSGQYTSPTQSRQSVAVRLNSDTELRGVSVTNGERRGTAVWIESANPTVINCTLTKSNREGIFAAGNSKPKILNNQFIENNGQGISITRTSAGEIRGNVCKKGGAGIVIDGEAIPQVIGNEFSDNRYGVQISQDAKPVLRKNRIENNSEEGISLTGNALPDFGSSSDPGGNILSNNGKLDIGNYTKNKLLSVGNSLNASKVKGEIEVKGGSTTIPDTKTPDTKTPDTKTPDTKTPDTETPDTETPDTETPDTKTPDTTPTLSDIQNHWAESFIQALIDKGMISGFPDGTFKPEDKMTRAQYAALLVKAFNPPAQRNAPQFTDVASNFWAKQVIEKAYRGRFLSGYPGNIFRPNDNVQRVQVTVSLVNGLGLYATDANALGLYEDRNAIPNYAKEAVVTATKKQMVVNYPNLKRLRPTNDATRAEVAAMVYQALADLGEVSRINSNYIVVA